MENALTKKQAEEVLDAPAYEVRPAVDVTEENEGITIAFEIPGVNSKGVELEVKERILSLTAKSALSRRGRPVVYKRAFQLSDAVDVENITAKTQDGVLTLFLPKSEKAKVHRIKVE